MIKRKLIALGAASMLTGCVTGFTLVESGAFSTAGLQVEAGDGWNLTPSMLTPNARRDSRTWTRDGLLLDRLVLIPGVEDGETLLVDRTGKVALPTFRKDMLPNEIEELTESTLVKFFGEGNAAVSTSALRPHSFGDNVGIMFDISAEVTDGPAYRGSVGAFISNDKLFTVWYVAAIPHYHGKHSELAQAVIASARDVSE